MYVAKCHVRLKDYTARPGEIFEEALEEETLRRLVRLGAVEKVNVPAPGQIQGVDGDNPDGAAGFPQSPPDGGDSSPFAKGEPLTGDGDAAEDVTRNGQDKSLQDESEAPTPPPVIDAMDGISGGKKSRGKKK